MPIPDRALCLEHGAAFIDRRYPGPITTSHEGDLMAAVEWALRVLAEARAARPRGDVERAKP